MSRHQILHDWNVNPLATATFVHSKPLSRVLVGQATFEVVGIRLTWHGRVIDKTGGGEAFRPTLQKQ
jgi:hypothetical protein